MPSDSSAIQGITEQQAPCSLNPPEAWLYSSGQQGDRASQFLSVNQLLQGQESGPSSAPMFQGLQLLPKVSFGKFWHSSAQRVPHLAGRAGNGNCRKNRQVQAHNRDKSVREILVAIHHPFPTGMKAMYVGYKQVGCSPRKEESTTGFFMQVSYHLPSMSGYGLGWVGLGLSWPLIPRSHSHSCPETPGSL